MLIDELERQIDEINRRLRAERADHPYVPLLSSVPGVGWVLAFTIAAEIGEIECFSSPEKFVGYRGSAQGQAVRRIRSPRPTEQARPPLPALGRSRRRRRVRHPAYAERYQRNKRRLGKQRGAKVAQVDIARRLAHAIWHAFPQAEVRSERRRFSSGGLTAPFGLAPASEHPIPPDPPAGGHRDMSVAPDPGRREEATEELSTRT